MAEHMGVRDTNRKVPWSVVGIVTCGVAGVVIGLSLVWLVRLTEIPARASLNVVPGMEFGIRGPDFLILGILDVGLLTSFAAWQTGRTRVTSTALMLSGGLASSVTVWRFVALTGPDGKWASYLLGPGAYVTIGGGALVLVGGGLLWDAGYDPPAASERREGRTATVGERHFRTLPVSAIGLAVIAVAGVVVGTWMEWLVSIPTAANDGVNAVSGTGTGISVPGAMLIGIVGTGVLASLVLSIRFSRPRLGGRFMYLSGLLPLLVPLWQYLTATDLSRTFNSDYLVAPGLYVTLSAGALLVVAGALTSLSGDHAGYGQSDRERRARIRRKPSLQDIPLGTSVVAVCGVACVVVGTRLYWLVSVPDVAVGSPRNHPWLEAGTLGSGEFLLGVVFAGVVTLVGISILFRRADRGGLFLLGTGVVSLGLTGWRVIATTGTDGMTLDAYFVAPGAYVTLGGGLLLVAAGAISHSTHVGVPASKQREPDVVTESP